MAKRRNRGRGVDPQGRSKRQGRYLLIPHVMLYSLAFRSLSGPALKLWIELRSRYFGSNNGKIFLSYQEAADLLHLSKSSVARAFRELREKGFIRLRARGSWYGRRAHEWIVTDEAFGDKPPTRDWERWLPPSTPEKREAVPRRRRHVKSDPTQYRGPPDPNHSGTRRPHLTIVHGATSIPHIVTMDERDEAPQG